MHHKVEILDTKALRDICALDSQKNVEFQTLGEDGLRTSPRISQICLPRDAGEVNSSSPPFRVPWDGGDESLRSPLLQVLSAFRLGRLSIFEAPIHLLT